MTTITAVQLRKDLDKIIQRASKGESIRVTYRGRTTVTIGPDHQKPVSNAAAILRKAKEISAQIPKEIRDKYRTDEAVKKLIEDERMRKYGSN